MKAKAYGDWYTWQQLDGGRWICRRTDWVGRPLDSFIGGGATQDEAFADLQATRNKSGVISGSTKAALIPGVGNDSAMRRVSRGRTRRHPVMQMVVGLRNNAHGFTIPEAIAGSISGRSPDS